MIVNTDIKTFLRICTNIQPFMRILQYFACCAREAFHFAHSSNFCESTTRQELYPRLLFYMIQPLIDDRSNMIIRQKIKDLLSLTPALYESCILQDPKLMGDR